MDVDSSAKFIGSLTKFLQSLCNGYVDFQKGVELVGHIYLSIDTGEKVDYILHERVSKNDENSVVFVSNSFHAQPLGKDVSAESKEKDVVSKSGTAGSKETSDDDDIMIVDQSKDVSPGSINMGTIPSRGARHNQRFGGSFNRNHGSSSLMQRSSPTRHRQQLGAGPSATVTSQENLNIGDVKLEQISTDELLSLASQVNEEAPSSSRQHVGVGQIPSNTVGKSAGQPVWIKQEAPDDVHVQDDTGWPDNQTGVSDGSNPGSSLYPVMLHQNPAFNSGPVFPAFPSSNASSHHHSNIHSLHATSGSANPYANPLPGTSQNLSGVDPTVDFQYLPGVSYGQRYNTRFSSQEANTGRTCSQDTSLEAYTKKERNRLLKRRSRQRMRENPEVFQRYRERERLYARRYQDKQKRAKAVCMALFTTETKHVEL